VALGALRHPPAVGAAADAAHRDDLGLVHVAAEELEGLVAHRLGTVLHRALRRLRHKPSPGALVRGHVGVPLAQHAAERELGFKHLLIRRKPEEPRDLADICWYAYAPEVCIAEEPPTTCEALVGCKAEVARCLCEILRDAVATRLEEDAESSLSNHNALVGHEAEPASSLIVVSWNAFALQVAVCEQTLPARVALVCCLAVEPGGLVVVLRPTSAQGEAKPETALSAGMSLASCEPEVAGRSLVVLRHARPFVVALAQLKLRRGIALLGSEAVPAHRLLVVLQHPLTGAAYRTQPARVRGPPRTRGAASEPPLCGLEARL